MAKYVVPYIGTWIETGGDTASPLQEWTVVPYIGTWIETIQYRNLDKLDIVVPYIGTWIETTLIASVLERLLCRTLYRYVD